MLRESRGAVCTGTSRRGRGAWHGGGEGSVTYVGNAGGKPHGESGPSSLTHRHLHVWINAGICDASRTHPSHLSGCMRVSRRLAEGNAATRIERRAGWSGADDTCFGHVRGETRYATSDSKNGWHVVGLLGHRKPEVAA